MLSAPTVTSLRCLLLLSLLGSCTQKTASTANTNVPAETGTTTAEAPVVPVRLATVQALQRAEPVTVTGLVSSAEEARLSFKIGGIIQKLYAEEGQTVRKGQLLASLNLTEIDAQVAQAQLSRQKADRDLARVTKLLADTAATLEQLQNATTGSNMATQNLTIAQFNRGYAQIRSSLNGTITRKLVNEGEFIAPGGGVYLLAGNGHADWVVRVGVSDKDWARLRPGDRGSIALDAYPNRRFTGSISQLAQAADPATKLYEAEIRISPAGAKLAPGLFAAVTLNPAQQRTYVLVPVEAIVEGNGKDGFVYVLETDRRHVRKQPVQISYISGANVWLTGGLTPDKQVITSGSAFLSEQSVVRVVK